MLAAALLKTSLAVATFLAGLLQAWGQRVESQRATVSLAAARNARESDRWRTAFEAAPLGMAKVNLDGRLEAVNSAWRALLGQPERALQGRRLSAFVYPDDLAALGGPGNPGGPTKGVAKAEVRLVCADGHLRWCELASSMVRDVNSRAEYVLVSAVDITRHKQSQAALRDLATRDPLSGLANRRWFELQLAQHLRMCVEDGPRGALLAIDLDHFKGVNDTLGHQAGDRLVVEVALSLRRHLRDQDVVARPGGDEFAVILREGDRWAAEAVARKLVLAVRDEVGAAADAAAGDDGTPLGVTISVGVAAFELLGDTTDLGGGTAARDALKVADAAMYSVKRSGRNGYAVAGTGEGPHHARPRPDVPDLSVDVTEAATLRRAGVSVS
jgi:diguanylate cyclase (GGDEF)-like protein/PAS domain S-box-containing protein